MSDLPPTDPCPDDEDDILAARQALAENEPSVPAERVWQELGVDDAD